MCLGPKSSRLLFAVLVMVAVAVPGFAAENRFGVAVIIGNSQYSHERVPDVAYAHRDAEAFKRYVIDVLGFREGNVIDLRDATQAQMVAAFGNESDFKGKVYDWVRPGRSDVVVFYSGHGVPGGGADRRGYLLPANAEPAKARLNGYPIDVLYKNLAQIEARSVAVFIDACFSGDTPRGMLIQSASPVFVEATLPEAVSGLTVLTAASGSELASWDEDRRHGLFTSYLLDGLYGAADGQDFGDGDGTVTLGELQGWLDSEMTYHARRHFSRDQHATVQGDGGAVLNAVPASSNWQVASLAPAPSFTVTALEDTLYTLKTANVRAGPGTTFDKVDRLDEGTEVEVTGQVDGADWLRIALADRTAYIYAPLLGDRVSDQAEPAESEPTEKAKPDPPMFEEQWPTEQTAAVASPPLKDQVPTPAQPAVGVYTEPEPEPVPPLPSAGQEFKDCDVCPEMVVVPAGSFQMGASPDDKREMGRDFTEDVVEFMLKNESPQHEVTIRQAIAVGKYEVTKGEYGLFVSETGYSSPSVCSGYESGRFEDRPGRSWRNPGFPQSDRDPVVCVSWDDARAYTEWLSQKTGAPYRLLSESEWEYAARAGTTTSRHWGNDSASACNYANVHDKTSKRNGLHPDNKYPTHACDDRYAQTAPVGSFEPNAFGLHDMLGNTLEWTADCWIAYYDAGPSSGQVRTLGPNLKCTSRTRRGSSWEFHRFSVRSAHRWQGSTDHRHSGTGFRVARSD